MLTESCIIAGESVVSREGRPRARAGRQQDRHEPSDGGASESGCGRLAAIAELVGVLAPGGRGCVVG
jgi:hypothetical protein